MPEHHLIANGLRHHVIEWGEENTRGTLVLCHGFLDLGWGFFRLAPLLEAEGYRVLSFDFRGHGETEWVGQGGYYHFADYVLDLHELLPQLSREPVHLVGHSMGGTVATLFAATHLASIHTLSLFEGLGPPDEDPRLGPERMKTWLSGVTAVRREDRPRLSDLDAACTRLQRRNPELDQASVRFLAEKSTEAHPSGQGLSWRFDPLHRTRSPMGFGRERFLQFTQLIDRPTLVLLGERGMRTGDDDLRIASLPRAESAVIAGAGHMMHWTHPRETAERLLAFLTQQA